MRMSNQIKIPGKAELKSALEERPSKKQEVTQAVANPPRLKSLFDRVAVRLAVLGTLMIGAAVWWDVPMKAGKQMGDLLANYLVQELTKDMLEAKRYGVLPPQSAQTVQGHVAYFEHLKNKILKSQTLYGVDLQKDPQGAFLVQKVEDIVGFNVNKAEMILIVPLEAIELLPENAEGREFKFTDYEVQKAGARMLFTLEREGSTQLQVQMDADPFGAVKSIQLVEQSLNPSAISQTTYSIARVGQNMAPMVQQSVLEKGEEKAVSSVGVVQSNPVMVQKRFNQLEQLQHSMQQWATRAWINGSE